MFTEKALSLDPSCAFPHVPLAMCYLLARQHEKAISACEQALKFDPNDASAYSVLSVLLTYSGNPKEAIAAFEKGLRINPNPRANIFLYQGLDYYHSSLYEEALAAWKKAEAVSPNAIDIRLRLASCYSALGREDEAREEVATILKMNPRLSLGYLAKTLPYKNQADLEKVINDLRKAGLK